MSLIPCADAELLERLCLRTKKQEGRERLTAEFRRLPNPTIHQLFWGMDHNEHQRHEETMTWPRDPTWEMTYDSEHLLAIMVGLLLFVYLVQTLQTDSQCCKVVTVKYKFPLVKCYNGSAIKT
jgi:hypothetical protein